jgi:N-acetylglucosaminyl-diphospho-decaprenol L-rhamnosyltransferase
VSWNDEEDLRGAVSSLALARQRVPPDGPRTSLFIVDNGGTLGDRSGILAPWPDACLLVNESNRGFGPAANQAAEAAPGDVLLFFNPDARAEGGLFSEIAKALDAHPEAAALAPRLLDFEEGISSLITNHKSQITNRNLLSPPDREDQLTFQLRRLPSLAGDARELLLVDHLAPNNPGRRRFRYAERDREEPFEIEQAAAAALAVRRDVFRQLGGFDPRFVPAWFEDVDFCARLSRRGKILYWPSARFRHRGGLSSRALGYPRFLPTYYRNALLYRRLHYGPLARFLYRPLLVAGMLLRLAALPFRPRVPRPRRESARAYLATLALALGFSSTRNSQITTHDSHD